MSSTPCPWPGSPEALPAALPPMLASQGAGPFTQDDWTFEPKLDGYRIVAWIRDGGVRLMTRGSLDLAGAFPQLAAELAAQPARSLVIDGELVAFDAGGKPSFSALQTRSRSRRARGGALVYYGFDVLHADGINTRTLPLSTRREVMHGVLRPSEHIQLVHADDDGLALFSAAADMGMEGIIAKRKSSLYQPGIRSGDWLKILAFKRADLLIVGYTGTSVVESLLVGYRRRGRLKYAAQVSGLGKLGRSLLPLVRTVPDAPPLERIDGAHWIAPLLVAEIRFREITRDGKLRHPVFYRMRDEIAPDAADFPPILPG
ncbi:MAG TPA: non-homologous end-joining DNA ligase [Noviherbaspirillum sp.]|uniref:non-homologous end-joining DNA ligase n=1 Tax=Noviherbaspirillum sp. TaxID=1926288 RepID=UPI002D4DEA7A|nr:non-homologous end-joining DNA ligase [Noviherbaspirillum sp.]HYD93819.1 non-homologous end-joining DNA ligase [Noviherbaspirillum sp.]